MSARLLPSVVPRIEIHTSRFDVGEDAFTWMVLYGTGSVPSGGQGASEGRGLLEIEEEVKKAIAKLSGANGLRARGVVEKGRNLDVLLANLRRALSTASGGFTFMQTLRGSARGGGVGIERGELAVEFGEKRADFGFQPHDFGAVAVQADGDDVRVVKPL